MSSFICKHCFSVITTCHFFFRVSFSLWCNKILYVSLSDQTLLDLFSKLTGLYFILNHIIPLDTSLSYYSFIFISWKSQGKGQHSVRPIPLLLRQHPKRMLSQVPIASPWTQPPDHGPGNAGTCPQALAYCHSSEVCPLLSLSSAFWSQSTKHLHTRLTFSSCLGLHSSSVLICKAAGLQSFPLSLTKADSTHACVLLALSGWR